MSELREKSEQDSGEGLGFGVSGFGHLEFWEVVETPHGASPLCLLLLKPSGPEQDFALQDKAFGFR